MSGTNKIGWQRFFLNCWILIKTNGECIFLRRHWSQKCLERLKRAITGEKTWDDNKTKIQILQWKLKEISQVLYISKVLSIKPEVLCMNYLCEVLRRKHPELQNSKYWALRQSTCSYLSICLWIFVSKDTVMT